jgi:hypothetical protein
MPRLVDRDESRQFTLTRKPHLYVLGVKGECLPPLQASIHANEGICEVRIYLYVPIPP